MVKRRQFLGMVTALSGSYVLTACGGGGGSGDGSGSASASTSSAASTSGGTTSSATSSGASGATTTTTAASATTGSTGNTTTGTTTTGSTSSDTSTSSGSSNTAPASADGTMIPPAASITDSQGVVWTVVNGVVYRAGVAAGVSFNVQLLIWYHGVIYHENTANHFYSWSGTTWLQCADPRLGGTSADGTVVPTDATQIIDKLGSAWTLANGVVMSNGTAAGTTSNAALLLWYGGKLWYQTTLGQFYVCADTGQWLACSDPRIAVAPASGTFHGINGHYDYRYGTAQLVQIMQNLGCSTYRIGCTDDATQISKVSAIAQAFQAAGLTLFVVLDISMYDSNGALYASESAAYTRGSQCGAAVADALGQYGVLMYECGNELTRDSAIILDSTNAGTKAADFNNANWPVMRGMMRGMIDGVKSKQSNAKCGINFCVSDVGAADALWDGQQPDGTSGHPTVRWDLTTWHNYEIYGDLFDIGTDGSGPGFDLPVYCKARYGVPFVISEWNTGPEQSTTYRANYITTQYAEYYNARKTKNIQCSMLYELDSGNDTYGIMIDGTPVANTYNAFVSFVASHADS